MASFVRLFGFFMVLSTLLLSKEAQAQFFTPPQFPVPYVPSSYWLMGNPGIGDTSPSSKSKNKIKSKKPKEKQPASSSTLITVSKTPSMPAKLAAKYPEGERGKIEKLYNDLLRMYPNVARQLNVPANDLSGAFAAFVAGSWTAYHSSDFKDEYFLPLTEQMRRLVANTELLKEASLKDKQMIYEQMVIAGVLMAVTHEALKQNPDEQTKMSLRETGEKYLTDFFRVDPDRIEIGAKGIHITE